MPVHQPVSKTYYPTVTNESMKLYGRRKEEMKEKHSKRSKNGTYALSVRRSSSTCKASTVPYAFILTTAAIGRKTGEVSFASLVDSKHVLQCCRSKEEL